MEYLIIALLGILLIVANRRTWMVAALTATAPAGGATTPPMRTRIWTFVDTHWDKAYGTAAALLTVVLVIWMVGWYKDVATSYYQRGGWGYWLLVPVAAFTLPALVWTGKVRKVLLWLLTFVVCADLVFHFIPAAWEVAWGPSDAAPVQTASVEPENRCDGIYRPRTLTAIPTLVTGVRGCTADWNIADGGVIVYNERGEAFPRIVTKDNPMGKSDFRIVRWKAAGASAVVDVSLRR